MPFVVVGRWRFVKAIGSVSHNPVALRVGVKVMFWLVAACPAARGVERLASAVGTFWVPCFASTNFIRWQVFHFSFEAALNF